MQTAAPCALLQPASYSTGEGTARHAFALLAALLLLLAPASARAQPAAVTAALDFCASVTDIRVARNALCFTGDIDAATAERAETLMGDRRLTAMVITSDGGEVTAALRLARALRARSLLLVVKNHCISSCANFLFPAARTKAVAPDSILIFHGGIAPGAFGGLFGDGEERELLSQTRSFFREIGVDGSITWQPPWRRDPRSGVRSLAQEWTATPAALRRHGVTGIVDMWFPSPEAVIRQAATQGMSIGIVD
jgi:hypothetical protein